MVRRLHEADLHADVEDTRISPWFKVLVVVMILMLVGMIAGIVYISAVSGFFVVTPMPPPTEILTATPS